MKPVSVIILFAALLALVGCETVPGADDKQPVLRVRADPVYPFELKSRGISGAALVEFIVDSTGQVRDAFAVNATHPSFGAAAVTAIYRWQFSPGIKQGRAVSARMRQDFHFAIVEEIPAAPPASVAQPK